MERLGNVGINRVVASLSFARMADAMGNSILVVIIPLYVADLAHASSPRLPESLLIGILIATYGLLFTFCQPFTAALSDRLGKRKLFIQSGLLLMALSIYSFSLATNFTQLLFIRGLQGFAVALTVPASLAVMSESSSRRSRGGSMGFYSTLRMVGFAIGPTLGGLLQVRYGFRAAFMTGTALVLFSTILVQIFVEDPEHIAVPTKVRYRILDRRLLGGGIALLGLATFFMSSAYSMMTSLENEFNLRLHQTALGFGLAFSALTVTRLIFQLPLGRLSDHIGRRPLIVGGLILMAPATAALGLVTSTWQLAGVRALQGLASAAIAAPAFALAADLSKEGGEGQQMSVISMGFGLGIAIGPLIAGSLATIRFELPFMVGALLTLWGAWLVSRGVPEPERSTASSV
ncbi:MAG: MFS transporter [Anaerolineales bacterium]|nr:MAG: MFS transporter [Anaerolineales bacterium]